LPIDVSVPVKLASPSILTQGRPHHCYPSCRPGTSTVLRRALAGKDRIGRIDKQFRCRLRNARRRPLHLSTADAKHDSTISRHGKHIFTRVVVVFVSWWSTLPSFRMRTCALYEVLPSLFILGVIAPYSFSSLCRRGANGKWHPFWSRGTTKTRENSGLFDRIRGPI
jgi:hypothetical protein